MTDKYMVGLDIGTSGCKAVLYSLDGKIIASASDGYQLLKNSEGHAELDTQEIWLKTKKIIRKVSKKVKSSQIEAICTSSLGEAIVPVSAKREILGNAIINIDTRGSEYINGLLEKIDQQDFSFIAGSQLSNSFSITKLMWIRDNDQELYSSAYKFLPLNGLIPFLLGSDPVVDYSQASRTLLFDLNTKEWSSKIIDGSNVDQKKLPEPQQTGFNLGRVSSEIAEDLGLSKNTQIILGPHDQCANAVGCGVISPNVSMISMGSFFCVVPVFYERINQNLMHFYDFNSEPFVLPGSYISILFNQGGLLIDWFLKTFVNEIQGEFNKRKILDDLSEEIPQIPSEILFFPTFAPIGSPDFILKPFGLIGGMNLSTTRGEIYKGLLQGVIFYLYKRILDFSKVNVDPTMYKAVGGASKSDKWVQMCADIIGSPIYRPEIIESATLGDNIIARVALSQFSSFEEACSNTIVIEKTFIPDEINHRKYTEIFERYLSLWNKVFFT